MHGKIYLTGDQGIILNGLVYYLGRKDENVKINGFKMRTADISDCALTQGGVKEAYTVWKPQGDKSEALFILRYGRISVRRIHSQTPAGKAAVVYAACKNNQNSGDPTIMER